MGAVPVSVVCASASPHTSHPCAHHGLWIRETLGLDAYAVRDVGLPEATDRAIFDTAREHNAVVMTKDGDFIMMLEHTGPPQVIWLTCGNTSNARLRQILSSTLPAALKLLHDGEPLVEISGA